MCNKLAANRPALGSILHFCARLRHLCRNLGASDPNKAEETARGLTVYPSDV
jgi:hypothetical protein